MNKRVETRDIAQTMATRMRELRAVYGLTLQQAADRASTGKSHIWELENGRSKNPSIEMAVSLARAFGVSLDYLTGLSSAAPNLHPEALRIAIEIDALLRRSFHVSDRMVTEAHAEYHRVLGDSNRSNPMRAALERALLVAQEPEIVPGSTREQIEAGLLSGDEPCECGETTVEECNDCCEPKPPVCPHRCYFPGDCDGSCTHPAPAHKEQAE